MNREELADMGRAVAAKFRPKGGTPGDGSVVRTKPPESHRATAQDGTLIEAPTTEPEVSRSILHVPQPTAAPETVQVLPLELILDSPYQPRRRELGKKELEDLANNIAANGQTTAIIVTRGTGENEGKYYVHSGQRRCAALRLLGWATVKAIVRDDLDEREAQRVALMDNLGREDLSAFDQAMGFKQYAEKYGLDGPTAARELGLSRRNAFRLQTIAKASQALLNVLRKEGVSLHAAERLVRIDTNDSRRAVRVAKRVVEGTITPEGLDREASGSSHGKSSTVPANVTDLRVSANRIHLTVGFRRGSLSSEQKQEIRTALATFLWHAELGGVQPQKPAGDVDLPVSLQPGDRQVV